VNTTDIRLEGVGAVLKQNDGSISSHLLFRKKKEEEEDIEYQKCHLYLSEYSSSDDVSEI